MLHSACWRETYACLTAVLAFALAACGDPPTTEPPLSTLSGRFTLRTLDGDSLPGLARWHGLPVTIVADTLTFNGSGEFHWASFTEPGPVTFTLAGAVHSRADSLFLMWRQSIAARGVTHADTLRLRTDVSHFFAGHVWVYVRAP
jgi:hypothetical protein